MDKKSMTAPFAKVSKTEDGGREVWGYATVERKDKSGEIADAEGTAKAFGTWSEEVAKRTAGKSLGNVRLMHQPITAGKMIHYEPTETTIKDEKGNDQVAKAIWVGAYIPPTKPDIIKDIDEGILSAFSIAGNYAKRWYDSAAKAFRFIPQLAEFSLVDNPCCEGADIVNVINKADGPWNKDNSKLNKEAERLMSKEAAEIVEDPKKIIEKSAKPKAAKVPETPEQKKARLAKEKLAAADPKNTGDPAADPDADCASACKALGISEDQFKILKGMFKKDALSTQTPAPAATTSLDLGAGTFGQGGLSLDVAGAAADIAAAETATFKSMLAEVKKNVETLETEKLSKIRTENMVKAQEYIKAALEDREVKAPAIQPIVPDEALKVSMGSLQKGIDGVNEFSKSINEAIIGSQNKIEALFKGITSQEDFKKMSDSLEAVSVLVKEIHETPVNNNTILNGGAPDVLKMLKGNNNLGSTDDSVLQKFMGETKDPMLKDKIGQEIAMRRMKQNMSNQGAR